MHLNPHLDLRCSFFVSRPLFYWSEIIRGGKFSSTAAFKLNGASWSVWDPTAAVEQTERMSPCRSLYRYQYPSPQTVFIRKSRIWRLG